MLGGMRGDRGEEKLLGPWIFGKGLDRLIELMREGKVYSRVRCSQLMVEGGFVHGNLRFRHPPSKTVSFREAWAERGAPITPDN